MMHFRQPILLPPNRQPLRVLIHAQFSTEERRQTSIDDQIALCKAFLVASLPKGHAPEQVAVQFIREVFERVAAGETAAEVGEWLDSIKFAKAKWSRQAKMDRWKCERDHPADDLSRHRDLPEEEGKAKAPHW